MEVFIVQEFRNLIPSLEPNELANLEESILEDGCRDAIVVWKGKFIIVDGHNRHDICTKHNLPYRVIEKHFNDDGAVKVWIKKNQLGRRNISAYLKGEYVFDIAEWEESREKARNKSRQSNELRQKSDVADSKKVLASKIGVSTDTASKIIKIHNKGTEDQKAKLRTGDLSINEAYKQIRRNEPREAMLSLPMPKIDIPDIELICADFKDAYKDIEPNSIDAIITDPPYPKEYLELYSLLAEAAHLLLNDHGAAYVMVGQSYLPEIIKSLAEHLRYHWTICYLTPGDSTILWQRKIHANWKPVLWFSKNGHVSDWRKDVIESPHKDKRFDEWGQSEAGITALMETYTTPGQLVLDPFMGPGTTAIIAKRLGRRFIGIDISPEQIDIAKKRLAQL